MREISVTLDPRRVPYSCNDCGTSSVLVEGPPDCLSATCSGCGETVAHWVIKQALENY